MKRGIVLFVLCFLLCGCTKDMTPDATSSDKTSGDGEPVAVAPVNGISYGAIYEMGDALLLEGEGTWLRYEPKNEIITAKADSENRILLTVSAQGVVCYDPDSRNVYFLDEMLGFVRSVTLPETVQGAVQISADQSRIYYCTQEGVAFLTISNGVQRMLYAQPGQWTDVTAMLNDDRVLQCTMLDDESEAQICYISAETGEMLCRRNDVEFLGIYQQRYVCRVGQEWIFGIGDDQPANLWVEEDAQLFPLLSGAQVMTQWENTLSCYDLNTGKKLADLTEDATVSAAALLDNVVYYLADGVLRQWDLTEETDFDDAIYTAYRYTREDPDEAGLNERLARAKTLEEKCGIDLVLWEDVVAVQPEGYTFDVAFVPTNYDAALTALESILPQFPADFFEKTAVKVVLVDTITTDVPNTHPQYQGMQYLLGGVSYIALELNGDIEQTLYHMLGHALDVVLMSNAKVLYDWNQCNPDDFRYDNTYELYADRTSKYCSGKQRYFIESFSMVSPVEDRATIFACAMQENQADCFSSGYLQQKLAAVCRAIRKAMELPEEETYLWEQYLQE